MSKLKFTLGILVSLFSLSLEVSIQAQPRETKPETATVSGLVTLKGEPARGVTVLLMEQRANVNNSPRAKSDENGRFRFTGVAAGRYSIAALAPGYVSMGDGYMGRWGQTLNLVYSALKLRGELKLVGGAAPDGVRFYVNGRRVDSQMQGSWGAEVDARGQFLIENALPGEYEVRVHPNYSPSSGRLDTQTQLLISMFRERVVISGANQQPIVLVIDLSRKEGNR